MCGQFLTNRANRWISVAVGAAVLIAAGRGFSQDWPQWRGNNRDGKVIGFTAPQTWPKTLTKKWKTTVGSGDATPALVGEKLYVFARQGDDEVTLCLSAADGSQVWQDKFAAQAVTGAGRGTKAVKIEKQGDDFAAKALWSNAELAPQCNTPVLQDGLLFGLSNRGNLYCINAQSGQTAWTDATPRDRGGFGSIVGAGPVMLSLPSSGDLIVYKTGGKGYEELAQIKVADTATYATPVVAGSRIFVKDQDGVTMWTIP